MAKGKISSDQISDELKDYIKKNAGSSSTDPSGEITSLNGQVIVDGTISFDKFDTTIKNRMNRYSQVAESFDDVSKKVDSIESDISTYRELDKYYKGTNIPVKNLSWLTQTMALNDFNKRLLDAGINMVCFTLYVRFENNTLLLGLDGELVASDILTAMQQLDNDGIKCSIKFEFTDSVLETIPQFDTTFVSRLRLFLKGVISELNLYTNYCILFSGDISKLANIDSKLAVQQMISDLKIAYPLIKYGIATDIITLSNGGNIYIDDCDFFGVNLFPRVSTDYNKSIDMTGVTIGDVMSEEGARICTVNEDEGSIQIPELLRDLSNAHDKPFIISATGFPLSENTGISPIEMPEVESSGDISVLEQNQIFYLNAVFDTYKIMKECSMFWIWYCSYYGSFDWIKNSALYNNVCKLGKE